jgi:hypothetical protein
LLPPAFIPLPSLTLLLANLYTLGKMSTPDRLFDLVVLVLVYPLGGGDRFVLFMLFLMPFFMGSFLSFCHVFTQGVNEWPHIPFRKEAEKRETKQLTVKKQ